MSKISEKIEKEIEKEKEEKKSECEKCAENEDWKDRYTRLAADFDNCKKQYEIEKTRILTNVKADVLEEILPVLDSIESANKMKVEGIEAILTLVKDVFGKLGVSEIETSNQKFDPNFHNAVMHVDDEKFGESEIIEEFAKGYKIGDNKVIRHSMVKVAN